MSAKSSSIKFSTTCCILFPKHAVNRPDVLDSCLHPCTWMFCIKLKTPQSSACWAHGTFIWKNESGKYLEYTKFCFSSFFFFVMNYSEMFTLMKWWTLKSLLIFLPQDVMRKVLAEMCSVWYSGNMLNQFKMLRHNWIINVFMSGHLKWCRYQLSHVVA